MFICLFDQGKTGYQIAKAMNIGERMVYRTTKRYHGNAKDKPRSERSITAQRPVNKGEIKCRIQQNPNNQKNSVRKITKRVETGTSSVQRSL